MKITSLNQLKTDDIILTVDLNNNESVEIVTCVDNGLWTIGYLDNRELFETEEELFFEYKGIYKIGRK